MKELLLVDDFQMIRKAFIDYLEDVEDFQITGEAGNGKEALAKLAEQKYDLLITDISMPEMDGLDLISQVNETYPNLKIFVLTMYHDQEIVRACLERNIVGYMAKNSERKKVIDAIRSILNGGNYWDEEIEALKNLTSENGGK